MTFAEFLAEQEKRIKLYGITSRDPRGGAQQSPGQLMATGLKVVNPYKPKGLSVSGEIFGKRPATNIMNSK